MRLVIHVLNGTRPRPDFYNGVPKPRKELGRLGSYLAINFIQLLLNIYQIVFSFPLIEYFRKFDVFWYTSVDLEGSIPFRIVLGLVRS